MSKKFIALMMALVLVLGLLSGCGGGTLDENNTTEASENTKGDTQSTEAGEKNSEVGEETTEALEETTEAPAVEITYPLENAGSLTWFNKNGMDLQSDYLDPKDSPYHNFLSKATGVDIQWQMVPIGASASTHYNLLFQEEKLPHIITGSELKYDELYEEGFIYDLRPYLAEYAPDYWAWLNREENEGILNSLKLEDGAIVAFICGIEELNCYSKGPLIRKDWLDECGLDIPYTLEDWEIVLTAFKEKYGIAPFSAIGTCWKSMEALASGTNAQGGLNLRLYVEDGVVKCAQLDEEWRELITTLARWYANGLITPDISGEGKKTLLPKAAAGQVGFVITDEAQATKIPFETLKQDPNANWISIPYPVPKKGDPVVYGEYEGTNVDNATIITTSCTEEELITAIKMLNYGYTEEGIIAYNYGEQGVSWEYDENGVIQLTDLVLNYEKGKTGAMNKYSPMNDGICPSIKTSHYAELRYDQTTIEAFKNWSLNSITLEYMIPELRYSSDDRDTRADLITTIETFLLPYAEKIILGQTSIDENTWTNLEKELNAMGLQEVIRITQEAYDKAYGN